MTMLAPRLADTRRPAIEGVPRDGAQPRYAVPAPLPPEAERLHRRQRLAVAFRLFSGLGYEVGLAGHFTATPAKDPAARRRAETSAWLSFLPLWDRVVREQPEVLG